MLNRQPQLQGVVCQADGQLLCWMNRLWVMLLVAVDVVLETALRMIAANSGKVIQLRDANPALHCLGD